MRKFLGATALLVSMAAAGCTGGGPATEERPTGTIPSPAGSRVAPCEGPFTTQAHAQYRRTCYLDSAGQLQVVLSID